MFVASCGELDEKESFTEVKFKIQPAVGTFTPDINIELIRVTGGIETEAKENKSIKTVSGKTVSFGTNAGNMDILDGDFEVKISFPEGVTGWKISDAPSMVTIHDSIVDNYDIVIERLPDHGDLCVLPIKENTAVEGCKFFVAGVESTSTPGQRPDGCPDNAFYKNLKQGEYTVKVQCEELAPGGDDYNVIGGYFLNSFQVEMPEKLPQGDLVTRSNSYGFGSNVLQRDFSSEIGRVGENQEFQPLKEDETVTIATNECDGMLAVDGFIVRTTEDFNDITESKYDCYIKVTANGDDINIPTPLIAGNIF